MAWTDTQASGTVIDYLEWNQMVTDILEGQCSSNYATHKLDADAHHSEVTLSGTPDYITIVGQTITRTQLDMADDTNITLTSGLTFMDNDTNNTIGVRDYIASAGAISKFPSSGAGTRWAELTGGGTTTLHGHTGLSGGENNKASGSTDAVQYKSGTAGGFGGDENLMFNPLDKYLTLSGTIYAKSAVSSAKVSGGTIYFKQFAGTTDATAAQLEELTNGTVTSLHSHAGETAASMGGPMVANIGSDYSWGISGLTFLSSQIISSQTIKASVFEINANVISGLTTPEYNSGATNKLYVDTISSNLSVWKRTTDNHIVFSGGRVGVGQASDAIPSSGFHIRGSGGVSIGSDDRTRGTGKGFLHISAYKSDLNTEGTSFNEGIFVDMSSNTLGSEYAINGTATGDNTVKNVALYGYASGALENYGLMVGAGNAQIAGDLTVLGNISASRISGGYIYASDFDGPVGTAWGVLVGGIASNADAYHTHDLGGGGGGGGTDKPSGNEGAIQWKSGNTFMGVEELNYERVDHRLILSGSITTTNISSSKTSGGIIYGDLTNTLGYVMMSANARSGSIIGYSGARYTNAYNWYVESSQKLTIWEDSGEKLSRWYVESSMRLGEIGASGEKYSRFYLSGMDTFGTISSQLISGGRIYTTRIASLPTDVLNYAFWTTNYVPGGGGGTTERPSGEVGSIQFKSGNAQGSFCGVESFIWDNEVVHLSGTMHITQGGISTQSIYVGNDVVANKQDNIKFREVTGYGFTFNYDEPNNNFHFIRHEGSETGNDVFTVERNDSSVFFKGAVSSQGRISGQYVTPLYWNRPPASATLYGQIIRTSGSTTSSNPEEKKTYVFMCVKNDADTPEWIQIGIST